MIILHGMFLGLLIAIPVGPIGMLCVQRTLLRGKISGLISGLGAATADAFYGSVAAFGLVVISGFLLEQRDVLSIVGGLFLIYIGLKSFYSEPKALDLKRRTKAGLLQDYLSTLFLTLTNPTTILSFLVLFAGTGFRGQHFLAALTLVVGVFLGSAIWWILLSFGIGALRSRVKNFSLETLGKVSGLIIAIFGLIVLVKVVG